MTAELNSLANDPDFVVEVSFERQRALTLSLHINEGAHQAGENTSHVCL